MGKENPQVSWVRWWRESAGGADFRATARITVYVYRLELADKSFI